MIRSCLVKILPSTNKKSPTIAGRARV